MLVFLGRNELDPCIYTFLPFECLYESGLVYNDTFVD